MVVVAAEPATLRADLAQAFETACTNHVGDTSSQQCVAGEAFLAIRRGPRVADSFLPPCCSGRRAWHSIPDANSRPSKRLLYVECCGSGGFLQILIHARATLENLD